MLNPRTYSKIEHHIRWNIDQEYLVAYGNVIPCSCIVRNEINNRRHPTEVVYSIPDKAPYQPRPFPTGTWNVSMPQSRTDRYTEPYFIPTDAFQILPVWDINDEGYVRKSTRWTKDAGYGLHYSGSDTTLGCIRIHERTDLLTLVKNIIVSIRAKERVVLYVRT